MVECSACKQNKTHAWIKFRNAIICLDCLCSITAIFTKLGLSSVYEHARQYQKGVIMEEPKE